MSEIANNCLTYSIKEVANLLGVSVAKAYDLCRNDIIPHFKFGKRYLVPIVAFNKWFETAHIGGGVS